jgi:hypothetical protein
LAAVAPKNSVKQARLDERAAQIQSQVAAERRRTQIIIAVFAVLVIGGGGILYFLTNPPNWFGGNATTGSTVTSASMGVVSGVGTGKLSGTVQTITDEGRSHLARPQRVTYVHQPPSSGVHYSDTGAPRPWGVVQTELLPEEYVHNLEHGGIVMVYRCSGTECDAAYAAAQNLFNKLPKDAQFNEVKFLATPYQGMAPKVALLSWDHEQDFTGIPTVADATTFYNLFVDKGPEALA